MRVIVFVNEKDKNCEILGKAFHSLLDRKYFVFARYECDYPLCVVADTFRKIRDIVSHTKDDSDRVIVCFGVRLLPNNLKNVEQLAGKNTGNLVFLKKLRGSKTWSYEKGKLSFDNERIADTGIFVLASRDITNATSNNFNTFIRNLTEAGSLKPVFVDWWIFSNYGHTRRRKR